MFDALPRPPTRRSIGCGATAILLAGLAASSLQAQQASATLFLVGDAGVASPERDSLLAEITRQADRIQDRDPDHPIAVVFLGDNVYDEGIRPDFIAADGSILVRQVTAGGTGENRTVLFLPGNHDWADGGQEREGVRRLQLQDSIIRRVAADSARDARLLPAPGCPGPRVHRLGSEVALVLIDTEWLLRSASSCGGDREAFLDRLWETLESLEAVHRVVLAHHPLVTGGPHGGYGPGLQPFAANLGVGGQDTPAGRYRAMTAELLDVFRSTRHPPTIYAAGHEHSLQLVDLPLDQGRMLRQIVSGSAAKVSDVEAIEGTTFRAARSGFVRVDFSGGLATTVVPGHHDTDLATPPRSLFACCPITPPEPRDPPLSLWAGTPFALGALSLVVRPTEPGVALGLQSLALGLGVAVLEGRSRGGYESRSEGFFVMTAGAVAALATAIGPATSDRLGSTALNAGVGGLATASVVWLGSALLTEDGAWDHVARAMGGMAAGLMGGAVSVAVGF